MIRLAAFAAALALLVPTAASAATLEQMAGQMVVVGFKGTSANDKAVKGLVSAIADGRIGGVMYLKTNVASLKAVQAMNAAFRGASPSLPPFITLDQEGGKVERLTKDVGFTEVPSAQDVAKADSPAEAEALYAKMAKGVAAAGFDVNFGPVVDVNVNPANPVIGKLGRSFGSDPAKVAAYAEAFVTAHRGAGVLTALKHFPGHGSSTGDSHQGFVDITDSWSDAELAPYKQMIADNSVDMVMVGHLYHADYSDGGDRVPSSLSKDWIDGVLRHELGFNGVVITDDLEMGAIRKRFSTEQTVKQAVLAGADLLLFSNTAAYDPELGDKIREIIVAAAESDPAFAARVEQSYNRIIALKAKLH